MTGPLKESEEDGLGNIFGVGGDLTPGDAPDEVDVAADEFGECSLVAGVDEGCEKLLVGHDCPHPVMYSRYRHWTLLCASGESFDAGRYCWTVAWRR